MTVHDLETSHFGRNYRSFRFPRPYLEIGYR